MDVTRSSVLVVDDSPANVGFLVRLLEREGYAQVRGITSGMHALGILENEAVDLLVLDLHMPDVDGYRVLEMLRRRLGDRMMPVLVLTADDSREARNRALASGARDFLTKPIDCDEARLRIRNLLVTQALVTALAQQNGRLEERVRQRTVELEQAQVEILGRLASIAEFNDEKTAAHTTRVAGLAGAIALQLGLAPARASLISHASLLHDVGKVAIPSEILRIPGPLTPAEWEIVRGHAVVGAEILGGSRFPVLQQAEQIARTHHERWDGTGYPDGLAGEEIPLAGRIVAAADVFDALTSARPYKEAWPVERALEELRRVSGSHLEPRVVEALERVVGTCDLGDIPQPELAALSAASAGPRPGYLDCQSSADSYGNAFSDAA